MDYYNSFTRCKLIVGMNYDNDIGRLIKYHGGSKVLLFYSNQAFEITNLLDRIHRSLKSSGLDYVECFDSNNNPRLDSVFEGIKYCHREDVDFILAIGASPECAVAKIIAAGSEYEENIYDIFNDDSSIEKALPIAVISTTVCGGCATLPSARVYRKLDDETLKSYSCRSDFLIPDFIIYNPELCHIKASEIGYNFVKIFNVLLCRYFSKNEVPSFAENIIEVTMKNVISSFNKLREKPNNVDVITNLIWASLSAYVNPMLSYNDDDVVSILSNAIVEVYDCRIEEAFSILIPAWFKFSLKKKCNQIAKLGANVFGIPYIFSDIEETAEITISKVIKIMVDFGMPVSLSHFNGNATDIQNILKKAGFPEVREIGADRKFNAIDCEVILSLAL